MTSLYILEEDDIKNIIANYFNVKNNYVHLEIYPIIENEVEVQKVQIKVIV